VKNWQGLRGRDISLSTTTNRHMAPRTQIQGEMFHSRAKRSVVVYRDNSYRLEDVGLDY